jgi:hypothetical protein
VKNWTEILSCSVLKPRLSSSASRDTDIKKKLIRVMLSLLDAESINDCIPEPTVAAANEEKTTEVNKI